MVIGALAGCLHLQTGVLVRREYAVASGADGRGLTVTRVLCGNHG